MKIVMWDSEQKYNRKSFSAWVAQERFSITLSGIEILQAQQGTIIFGERSCELLYL